MVGVNYYGNKFAVFTLLICALLLNEILACNNKGRFNKQDRYYRRHDYRRYYGKRSAENYGNDQAERSVNHNKYKFIIKTTCGDILCDSVFSYPQKAITKVVKELLQIYESNKASFTEEIDPLVMNFLSNSLNTDDSLIDSPEIVYEESKGCQALGNISYPQEGHSNDDGNIYYVVNVPTLEQKANRLTCKKSKKECGDSSIELPATYFRTCQQVDREAEFLVLPINKSKYSVADFRVRTFYVPNGCKCILLHTGDYEFLKAEPED